MLVWYDSRLYLFIDVLGIAFELWVISLLFFGLVYFDCVCCVFGISGLLWGLLGLGVLIGWFGFVLD